MRLAPPKLVNRCLVVAPKAAMVGQLDLIPGYRCFDPELSALEGKFENEPG